MLRNKAQAGMEYLIVVGFITFILMSMLVVAYFYINASKSSIKENQIQVFADNVLNSAESVFYSGEPSQVTITIYLPDNIKSVSVSEDYFLVINSSSSSGFNIQAFKSNVKLSFLGEFPNTEGYHKLLIQAQSDGVLIEDAS